VAVSLALGLTFAPPELAADGQVFAATDGKWKAECGSCHVAYPARLLSRRSWQAVMRGLEKHFGTDASVDPATAAEITTFLEQNAGRERRPLDDAPPLRITETSWFKHEHDEMAASIWKHPQVNTAANCGACHTGADQGNFSEHSIRVPK
jgi:hypothetical protein